MYHSGIKHRLNSVHHVKLNSISNTILHAFMSQNMTEHRKVVDKKNTQIHIIFKDLIWGESSLEKIKASSLRRNAALKDGKIDRAKCKVFFKHSKLIKIHISVMLNRLLGMNQFSKPLNFK